MRPLPRKQAADKTLLADFSADGDLSLVPVAAPASARVRKAGENFPIWAIEKNQSHGSRSPLHVESELYSNPVINSHNGPDNVLATGLVP